MVGVAVIVDRGADRIVGEGLPYRAAYTLDDLDV